MPEKTQGAPHGRQGHGCRRGALGGGAVDELPVGLRSSQAREKENQLTKSSSILLFNLVPRSLKTNDIMYVVGVSIFPPFTMGFQIHRNHDYSCIPLGPDICGLAWDHQTHSYILYQISSIMCIIGLKLIAIH